MIRPSGRQAGNATAQIQKQAGYGPARYIAVMPGKCYNAYHNYNLSSVSYQLLTSYSLSVVIQLIYLYRWCEYYLGKI